MGSTFRGGIPYAPLVKKLEEAFPLPVEGQIISYETLEGIIGERYGTARYYNICTAWRKRLFVKLNIDFDWEVGSGIKILTPPERLDTSERQFLRKSRQVMKAYGRHQKTPRERLDSIGQQRYDHDTVVMSRTVLELRDSQKKLAIELNPTKYLPRPEFDKAQAE